MPIAIDGQKFDDEFQYAASQLASPEQKENIPITDTKNQSYEDISQLPRITVRPRPIEDKPMDEPFKSTEEKRGVIDKLLGLTGDRYQTWPEKAAKGILDAFKLPGDVYQGKEDPTSEHVIGRATELAGALIAGPAPIARKVVDGTLGSIAGIGAKTVNKADLSLAQAMEAKGLPTEQIWQATKFYKGIDGKWKFEIPDNKAFLTDLGAKTLNEAKNSFQESTLGKVLDFPELYKAYPHLKDVTVHFDKDLHSVGALLTNETTGKATLSINPTKVDKLGTQTSREVILHEIQHDIQRKEGFDKGSNPTAALNSATQFLRKRLDEAQTANDLVNTKRLHDTVMTLQADPLTYMKEPVSRVLYKRTPGEVEANLVQTRMNWTPEQRAMESPKGTTIRGGEQGFLPIPLPGL